MPKGEVGPLVGIIMGSSSDWETMRHAAEMLDALGDRARNQDRVRAPHARSGFTIMPRARRTAGSR